MKNNLLASVTFLSLIIVGSDPAITQPTLYQDDFGRLKSYYGSDKFKQLYGQVLARRGPYTNLIKKTGPEPRKFINPPINIPPVAQPAILPIFARPTMINAFAAYPRIQPIVRPIPQPIAQRVIAIQTVEVPAKPVEVANTPPPTLEKFETEENLPVKGMGYVSAKMGIGRLPKDFYIDPSGDHLKIKHKESYGGSLAAGVYLNDLNSNIFKGFRTEVEIIATKAKMETATGSAAAATTPGTPATAGTPGTPGVPALPGVPAIPAVPATPAQPATPASTTPPPAPSGERNMLAGMINLAYDMDTSTKFTPYLGVGAGISKVSSDDYVYTNLSMKTNGDFKLTGQIFGGLKYQLNDQLSFDFGGRYIHVRKAIQSSNSTDLVESPASVFEGNMGLSLYF